MQFSYSLDGNKNITENFLVREFRCKDGSDKILIEPKLATILQEIRDYFGSPIIINSGYRSQEYNSKVGGSKNSLHTTGEAADIKVSNVPCNIVATYLDARYPNSLGIEVAENDSYIHIDIRKNRWRAWTEQGGNSYKTVNKFYPKQ